MRNATILASGSYAPEQIIPNSYFDKLLGQDVDSWLRENVQIYERRWCTDIESTADLVEKACIIAMESGNINPSEIDLLIIATDTPEYISPSTSSVIQDRLKLINAGTFDVNTACAGFVTALDIGAKYIKSDAQYNKVMVVGAYTMSKYLNKSDKKTVTLFADGAGVVILGESKDDSKVLQSQLLTKGEYNSWMGIYSGGSKKPLSQEVLDNKTHQLQFVHRIPTEINPEIWSKMIVELCDRESIKPSDIDHFFFTQININSIFKTMELLDLEKKKAATIMHNYGYTGSACIPMAFDIWNKIGKLKKGDLAVFIGSGGGLAFGSALVRL